MSSSIVVDNDIRRAYTQDMEATMNYGYAVVAGEQVWGVGRTMDEAERRTRRWANAPQTYRIRGIDRAEYMRLTADRMD